MSQLKQSVTDFALFGGQPFREETLPFGQFYFPSWERYESAMKGIFERQYYTNQGPLTQELEERLSDFFGVKHVICVTNATIGFTMAVKAMSLKGKIVVPSFAFPAIAQSITWAGLEPVFCDVDLHSHHLSPETIQPVLDEEVSAILAVNLWGGSCNPSELESFATKHHLHLYFDSAHAFGCSTKKVPIGRFGVMEVFSFNQTNIMNATEGGCITTNDDELAARLRNIRSSYGAGRQVKVPLTSNGRMSEAQAAIALLSLEDFPDRVAYNSSLFKEYKRLLEEIPGLTVIEPCGVDISNYQYLVCEVHEGEFGMTRDQLVALLKAENIDAERLFYPGIHKVYPYDKYASQGNYFMNTDALCQKLFQLPIGSRVTHNIVTDICNVIDSAHTNAEQFNWDKVR